MAKRKKPAKVQKRGKLPRGKSATRGKAGRSKAARSQAKKRTAAQPKPERAPAKKAARRVKRPIPPAAERIGVDEIGQPAPGVIDVSAAEEEEVRKAS